jgi:hypothetical protein
MKSLHQFMAEKQAPFAVRFDASLPTLTTVNAVVNHQQQAQAVSYRLFSLPLYLVERLGSIAAFPLPDADS